MKREDMLKRVKLDNFDELDNLFEITSIKEEEFLLRKVRGKIMEKYESMMNLLNRFLNPESGLIEMGDADCFDAEDRDKIADMLKQLSIIVKEHVILELQPNDAREREFCKNARITYKRIAPELVALVEKSKSLICNTDKAKEGLDYMG